MSTESDTSIPPIAHAARVLAEVLANVPDGAVMYCVVGQQTPDLVQAGCAASYVTLGGPGAVDLLQNLGATANDWYGPVEQRQRTWRILVQGVEFGTYEVVRAPAEVGACVPA